MGTMRSSSQVRGAGGGVNLARTAGERFVHEVVSVSDATVGSSDEDDGSAE
jgi:hypothetical protein